MTHFAAYTTAGTPNGFQRARRPQHCKFPWEDLNLHLIHGSLSPQESAPKWHLDQFSHICTALSKPIRPTHKQTDRQTDTQTMLRATSVATGHILCSACYTA